MRYFVYLLLSTDDKSPKTYVGWTTDLDKRLKTHNQGKGAKSTRGRIWMLAYCEKFFTRHEAMSREWHLKRARAFRANFSAPSSQSGARDLH